MNDENLPNTAQALGRLRQRTDSGQWQKAFIVCTLIVLMVAAAILLNTDSVQKDITE